MFLEILRNFLLKQMQTISGKKWPKSLAEKGDEGKPLVLPFQNVCFDLLAKMLMEGNTGNKDK